MNLLVGRARQGRRFLQGRTGPPRKRLPVIGKKVKGGPELLTRELCCLPRSDRNLKSCPMRSLTCLWRANGYPLHVRFAMTPNKVSTPDPLMTLQVNRSLCMEATLNRLQNTNADQNRP